MELTICYLFNNQLQMITDQFALVIVLYVIDKNTISNNKYRIIFQKNDPWLIFIALMEYIKISRYLL